MAIRVVLTVALSIIMPPPPTHVNDSFPFLQDLVDIDGAPLYVYRILCTCNNRGNCLIAIHGVHNYTGIAPQEAGSVNFEREIVKQPGYLRAMLT